MAAISFPVVPKISSNAQYFILNASMWGVDVLTAKKAIEGDAEARKKVIEANKK